MNVFLTFDIEVWCGGWKDLDRTFPKSYKRYVFGDSAHGQFALPKTLEILRKYGLQAVFFVEPLFAARFGREYLFAIVEMIRSHDFEIQLHLHPEWIDEITPPIIENSNVKRQHLCYYTEEEQYTLVHTGLDLLREAGVHTVSAFRGGSFAVNKDTFLAIRKNGILIDSSVNRSLSWSATDLGPLRECPDHFCTFDIDVYPMTVFIDGFGKKRHAQIGACSFTEMRDALLSASSLGYESFVILSHNFEMLKPASSEPDFIVVKRFQELCKFLQKNDDKFKVTGFNEARRDKKDYGNSRLFNIDVKKTSTVRRLYEQAMRRLNVSQLVSSPLYHE
jgi:peptidoglycan/xylan/chitin deacetylase (PgdA/CDA1 family)